MPTVPVGPIQLYYEVRGSGPPLMLIMGATGDAGHFATVAQRLAADFTVLTYDRRGNSRSSRPPDWGTTSPEEQADDAAGLVRALGFGSVAVFGTSSGAICALSLVTRHPDLTQAAILHEPPMLTVLERGDDVQATLAQLIEAGMAAGGPRGGLEAFWRFVAGDANWERLDPGLRERMLGNAETFLNVERMLECYRPDDATLAAIATPIRVLVSEECPPFMPEICEWLALRLGVGVATTPGTHTPYQDHPHELTATIRSSLTSAGDGRTDVLRR
jgi:pimeloyl-ACP methyl ester carboxylesterase